MVTAILFCALSASAVTDARTREIPVWLFPSALVLCLAWWAYTGTPVTADNIIGAAAFFVPTLILCISGKMGGGDLIMFTVTGFILGFYALPAYIFWIGFVSLVLVAATKCVYLAKHKRNRVVDMEIPLAPVAMAAYAILLIRRYLCIL